MEWRRHAKGLGKQSEKLWKRFHAANDRYFTGLKAARKKRFQELEANVPIREELIRRARALSEGSDAGTVRNSVRALMLEWKEAPPVPRKRSDPLWEAFRTACDQARDRFRGGSRSNGASGADGGPADAPSGLSEDEEAALRARVAELGDLPAAERAAVAEAVWTEYRRLRRVGEPAVTHATSVPRIERELAASLREAFAEAPETFPGTRFNQANLTRKLGALLRSLQKLDRRPRRATTESGVVGLAEQLRRSLQQGSPADPDAEARSAARTAARTFERARALGPALSPAAVKNLNRLERLAKKVIARAPAPPDNRRSSSRRSRGRRSRRNPRLSRFDRRSPAVPAHGAG